MAEEKKILYKIVVDGETAKATIFNLTGGVKKLNIAVEDLDEVLGDMNGEMSKTTSSIGTQMASLKKQRSQVQINSKEYQNLTKAMRFYQSQMDMSTGATGSASSAAMELGRVLSDAPYGIRGVANNISQFASQMAFAAKSTGSLKLAVQDLFKALTGPLGILLAIQTVIAVFEKMSMSKQKAKEDSEDLNKALKKEIQTLEGYVNVLNHSNSSLEERNGAILALISSDKKYIKSILEGNKTLSEQEQAVRALYLAEKDKLSIIERRQRAEELSNTVLKEEVRTIEEVQAAIDKLNKRYEEAAMKSTTGASSVSGYYETLLLGEKNVLEALKERKKIFDSLVDDVEVPIATKRDSEAFLKESISDLEKIRSKTAATSKEYRDQTTSIDVLKKQLEELTGIKKKEGSIKKLSPFATPKELEIDIKNAENAIIQYEKKIEDANLKEELNDKLRQASTEEEKKLIREAYQVKRLESQIKSEGDILKLKKTAEEDMVKTKTANHIDDMEKAKELFEYKMELEYEAGRITKSQRDELIKDSETKLKEAETQALSEQTTSLTEISSKYEPLFVLFEDLSAARMDALFSGFGEDDGEDEDSDLEFGIKQYMILQSGLTDFLNGEYDRQLTIEQNKTNAMNNQLRERLNNENLSAEERKNIQLQIARNDEQLRKKQEEIEKKRFKVQKAINIANALVDTYRSGVMAFGSQLVIGDPTSPIRAQIAQGVAIAAGLANVAMIARQKFQSTAGGAPTAGALGGGGSGGGDNTREFNFNLAGSTQSNQLTQSIAGQLSQPIQTYVVSSEITSQQQLDLNIANTATIGG